MQSLDKLFAWLKTLPSWARVAVIVLLAALAVVLSLTSCAAQAKVQRHGVHIDTVRVDYIIRSNNYQIGYDCSRSPAYESLNNVAPGYRARSVC